MSVRSTGNLIKPGEGPGPSSVVAGHHGNMLSAHKVLLLVYATWWNFPMTGAETAKRDHAGQPGLGLLHLGHLGPISRLVSHPSLVHLGLTPQQSTGFVHVLLQNGLLSPGALGPAAGELLPGAFPAFFPPPLQPLDPYFLHLLFTRPRYLPYGLGPQGIYGSTGLPRPKPFGAFKYNDKN